jgi:hypothetical protein
MTEVTTPNTLKHGAFREILILPSEDPDESKSLLDQSHFYPESSDDIHF